MRITIIFSLIFLGCVSSSSALYNIPENIYTGYGYTAGVDNINAVLINPANLYLLKQDEIYTTFQKPFAFYSFVFGVPVTKSFYTGLGFVSQNENFQQFRLGFNLLNSEYIKLGISTGLDREHALPASDKIGFSLSPGATALLLSADDIHFNVIFGLMGHNLIALNEFKTMTNFSRSRMDMGLRMELFTQDLYLNLGGDYFMGKLNFSTSLEYYFFDFINIGIALQNSSDVNMGFTMNFVNHYIGFAFTKESWCLSYSLSLNNMLVQPTPRALRRQVRYVKHASPKILEMQKQLLDEGLRMYKEKQYEQARSLWRKLIEMAPSTEYAKEAKNYIDKVNNILKSINE